LVSGAAHGSNVAATGVAFGFAEGIVTISNKQFGELQRSTGWGGLNTSVPPATWTCGYCGHQVASALGIASVPTNAGIYYIRACSYCSGPSFFLPDGTLSPASRPGGGSRQLPTGVPNQSPASRSAAWPAAGSAMYWDDGVGPGGPIVGGYPLAGHSDQLQPAAVSVADSAVEDPTAQLGMAHQRLGDFTGHQISPLPGRADWRGTPSSISDVGQR